MAMASHIDLWPLDRFIPYARNARTHSDSLVEQIAASTREFRFVNATIARLDRATLAGHADRANSSCRCQCSARKFTKLRPDSDRKLRLVSVCSTRGEKHAGHVTANAGTDRVRTQVAQSEPSDDAAPTALRHLQRGGNRLQEQQSRLSASQPRDK